MKKKTLSIFLTLAVFASLGMFGQVVQAAKDDVIIGPRVPVVRSLAELVARTSKYFFPVAFAAAGLMLLIGGAIYMSAPDNPERKTKGKKTLFWAVLGLIIFLLAKTIANIVEGLML